MHAGDLVLQFWAFLFNLVLSWCSSGKQRHRTAAGPEKRNAEAGLTEQELAVCTARWVLLFYHRQIGMWFYSRFGVGIYSRNFVFTLDTEAEKKKTQAFEADTVQQRKTLLASTSHPDGGKLQNLRRCGCSCVLFYLLNDFPEGKLSEVDNHARKSSACPKTCLKILEGYLTSSSNHRKSSASFRRCWKRRGIITDIKQFRRSLCWTSCSPSTAVPKRRWTSEKWCPWNKFGTNN